MVSVETHQQRAGLKARVSSDGETGSSKGFSVGAEDQKAQEPEGLSQGALPSHGRILARAERILETRIMERGDKSGEKRFC